MNNYILTGSYKGKINTVDYFSSDNCLFDIAQESENCYKDKDITIEGAYVEDQVTGEQIGGKALLNAFYDIVEIENNNVCSKIYLVKELGDKLKFNRYKGVRYYVLHGESLGNAIMHFNDDLTHDDHLTENADSLILIDTIHC